MRYTFFLTIIFSIGLTLSSFAQAASLSSRVDRNQITQTETLTLTLSYDDTVNVNLLDTSPLDQDFEVLSSSPQKSNHVVMINGQTSSEATTSWVITLAPKRQGKLLIPTLELNGQRSQAIFITVSDSAATANPSQPIEVSVTVDKKQVYPGQQILLTVRLSAIGTVQNLQGEPLTITGADTQLFDQQETQEVNNGITRQVIELRYAVYPEQAGDITIPAQTFAGTIGARRSFFDAIGTGGKRVGARSQPITITVNPKPATQGHNWFPAEQVSITSQWSTDTTQMRVGEPITRSITIQAQGQRASGIPPLTKTSNTDYKSYADKAQLENKKNANGLVGIREESTAIIPSNSGELTLPEQRIHWWNTQTQQWQQSTLPAETITVLPSLNTATSSTIPNPTAVETTSGNAPSLIKPKTQWLWKISTAVLALLCLLQFLLLYKLKHASAKPKEAVSDITHNNEKQAWAKLQTAFNAKNATNTRQQLLNWARTNGAIDPINNLQTLVKFTNDEQLVQILQALDRHLYKDAEDINWTHLSEALKTFRKELNSPMKKDKTHTLQPLYPS